MGESRGAWGLAWRIGDAVRNRGATPPRRPQARFLAPKGEGRALVDSMIGDKLLSREKAAFNGRSAVTGVGASP